MPWRLSCYRCCCCARIFDFLFIKHHVETGCQDILGPSVSPEKDKVNSCSSPPTYCKLFNLDERDPHVEVVEAKSSCERHKQEIGSSHFSIHPKTLLLHTAEPSFSPGSREAWLGRFSTFSIHAPLSLSLPLSLHSIGSHVSQKSFVSMKMGENNTFSLSSADI